MKKRNLKKDKYIGMFLAVSFVFAAFLGNSIKAQTQQEMNKEACDEYSNSDKELNAVYQRIRNEYKDDRVFINSLTKAQQAWIVYRDAYVDSIFPEKDKRSAYGSVYQMCRCNELKKITDQRIKELNRWIEGVEEGDVCTGSIKTTSDSADDGTVSYRGSLQVGATDSVILYFGEESGDYAAFCFANKSEVGRAILSACKDGEQCEFTGKLTEANCVLAGLEASLSASGKIVSLESVKSMGKLPESEPLQCTVVTKGGDLNVRTNEGKIIGKLKNNTSVFVNDASDDGRTNVSVRRKGKLVVVGWVSSDYLSCSAH